MSVESKKIMDVIIETKKILDALMKHIVNINIRLEKIENDIS